MSFACPALEVVIGATLPVPLFTREERGSAGEGESLFRNDLFPGSLRNFQELFIRDFYCFV